MPKFEMQFASDGKTVGRILKDGADHKKGVVLEQCYSVVSIYFEMAAREIDLSRSLTDQKKLRESGLKCLLFCMTGIEAFTNTYFLLISSNENRDSILKVIESKTGTTLERLKDLMKIAFVRKAVHHVSLFGTLSRMQDLRHHIVHPKWVPSSASFDNIEIRGLVENKLSACEDKKFIQKTYYWSILLLAEIARLEVGTEVPGFLFYWAGVFPDLSISEIEEILLIKKKS